MIDVREVQATTDRLTTPTPCVRTSQGTPAQIVTAITRGYWRRSTVDPGTAADITAKVTDRVGAQAPIEFSVPFGGYKGSDLPWAPDLNWAEVMWLGHLRSYAVTVAELHPPGVVLSMTYYSHALDLVNNLPLEDQQHYIAQLVQLAKQFSDDTVRFDVVDLVGQHGGAQRFRAEFVAAVAAASNLVPTDAHLRSASRNLVRRGVVDYSELDPQAWQARVRAAAQACVAMESLPPRRRFNKTGHRVQIGHIRGPQLSLHLGSTRTSSMQPWVAAGYLRTHRDGLIEHLSRRVLPAVGVPVVHELGWISPQLLTVPVLTEPLD